MPRENGLEDLAKWLFSSPPGVQAGLENFNDEIQDTKMALDGAHEIWLNGLQKMQIFVYIRKYTLKEGKFQPV